MFTQARLKLTAWYLLIIMTISFSFSAVIYQMVNVELNRFANIQRFRFERRLPIAPTIDLDLIEETKRRFSLILLSINGGILIISGGLSFFLAGRTLKPIKDMLDEQNRFISDSSHELRTPLTSLKSAMEVALRDRHLALKDAKKLIIDNLQEVNQLQTLSDELLQLAQYQKPNNNTKFEKLSLSEIVNTALNRIRPLADKKQISLKNQVKNISIVGSKYSLIDLFQILLDNAVKYSPSKKSVLIKSNKTDGSVNILVVDQGIGIAPKDLPHIFDRFYRADSARSKSNTTGYGLGLSIAKKITEMHHGQILVKSLLGKGSQFKVTLPVSANIQH